MDNQGTHRAEKLLRASEARTVLSFRSLVVVSNNQDIVVIPFESTVTVFSIPTGGKT